MAARRLRRLVAHTIPWLGVALTFALLAREGFRLSAIGWGEGAAVGLLLLGVALVTGRRLRRDAVGAPPLMQDDLELGACLVALAYAIVTVAGVALYPVIYLLMAFLVSFLARRAGVVLLAVALAFDAVLTLTPPARITTFATHAAFIVLFAALYHLVLRARLLAARRAESDAVKNRIREVEERARTFRLVNAGTQDGVASSSDDQEKWLLASVKEVEGAVGAALEIGEAALRTHTCAVFLLTSDDRGLKLHDCRSVSDAVQRERFPAGEGLVGGVLKRRAPVRMHSPYALKGISYYDSGAPDVHSVLVVPIVEGSGLVRGVLVADRLQPEPFSDQDERVLSSVGQQVLRAIEVERVMTYIRKTRDEKDRFFRAIDQLNRAGSPAEVFEAVLESARQMAGLDFCAVTLVKEDEGKRVHRIMRMFTQSTSQGKAFEGQAFEDNTGLVANVVRYGTPLPGRDLRSMERHTIFNDELQVRGLSALKIFPLRAGDRILGTLVAGSVKRTALDEDVLHMLEVMAIQAAQAVLRAQLYEQMERMATTDGMTGLLNHRTFQAKADETLAHAKRYGRKCSFILTDVDHFKSVNDTYGHSTGDQVLKGVARLMRENARDTDIVARYGGEEFVIIMPETDAKGAQAIAERIREAVKAEVFQTEMGPLKVTMSLGIATAPDNSVEKQALLELADQCLYFAKRNGRNQTVTVHQMQQGNRKLQAVGS